MATQPHKPDGYTNKWLIAQIDANADEISSAATEVHKLVRDNDAAKDKLIELKDKVFQIKIWLEQIERTMR